MFLFALFLKKVKPHASLNLSKRVLKIRSEKTAVVFGRKVLIILIIFSFFSFFFFFFSESVMLSTSVHNLQSTHILQSTNHIFNAYRFMFFKRPFKWALFRGDGGAGMYIKSNLKS